MALVYTIKYVIYQVSDDGLLKHPTEDYYGHDSRIFNSDGYDSQQEALIEIAKRRTRHDFAILPTAVSHYAEE